MPGLGLKTGIALLVALVLCGGAVAAAAIYDHGRSDRLAPGIRIGGVDVGGMKVADARTLLQKRVLESRRRTLRVHEQGHTFTLPASRSRVTAELEPALQRALADSRRGWLGARVRRELAHTRIDERVRVPVRYATAAVTGLVAQVSKAVRKDPSDASVKASATGLSVTPSHEGRALDAAALRHALTTALVRPARPADITATTHAVAPKTSQRDLAARYPAYIIVDRHDHVLRFYRHLALSRTYPIAVGRQGLETPAGLYDIQWKQTNPSWYVPNSPWAGKLAGKTIPPGPQDPIKARWMAFNGGAGIHGIDPSEYSSIGHDASHGCVRMRIPDVIALYSVTPVHTPVFVA
jgi:lipoprotein-anchoring transpeptidase ErfK/SrfK